MQIDFEEEYWHLKEQLAILNAKLNLARECYLDHTLTIETIEVIFPEWKVQKNVLHR